ncbi:MAG TPA: zf-HC2 domain-containing protein [Gemmatimonadaceae bacterium]
MQHLDEGTIHSWLDGALTADEAARVEAHVKECPQCAAAVAEARGFIAASSRILTALDNAPRGVIPVAATKKRVDPIVWRVAATLLVVAAGTLVVFRDGGRQAPIATRNAATVPNAVTTSAPTAAAGNETHRMTAESTPVLQKPGNSTQSTAVGGLQSSAGLAEKSALKGGAVDASKPRSQALPPVPPVTYQAEARAPAPQPNTSAGENRKVAGQAGGAVTDNISISSANARAAAPAPQAVAPIRLRGASSPYAASEQVHLNEVGTLRRLGAKVTLYEVTPGDTVTFTEPLSTQLESVVTTGSSAGERARQLTGKAAAAPSKRADAAVVSVPDSQRPTAVEGALAGAPSALVPATHVEVANGLTTITWIDTATGNTLKLSGRVSEARLQQIKISIERERAAAAAKKQP